MSEKLAKSRPYSLSKSSEDLEVNPDGAEGGTGSELNGVNGFIERCKGL